MTIKCAVINMKGGVGKSTLSVNLAWHFSAMKRWSKRVLLVDLDPQFNASQYTLGQVKYQTQIIENNAPTVWDIFEQATRAPGLRTSGRKLNDAIRPIATYAEFGKPTGGLLNLIPSQLELSHTLRNPSQKEHLLSSFIAEVEGDYDLIIVDCAPTESVLTTAAYLTCDKVLVPVKPDYLSTIGLPLIQQSMSDFARLYKKSLELVGVCFNACSNYTPEESKSKNEVRELAKKMDWFVFDEEIPESRSFPKGAREGKPIFGTSYAREIQAQRVADFCDAFAGRISL